MKPNTKTFSINNIKRDNKEVFTENNVLKDENIVTIVDDKKINIYVY